MIRTVHNMLLPSRIDMVRGALHSTDVEKRSHECRSNLPSLYESIDEIKLRASGQGPRTGEGKELEELIRFL